MVRFAMSGSPPARRRTVRVRVLDGAVLARLTARERRVLELARTGAGSREIAAVLGVGEETARSHLRALRRKTGLRRTDWISGAIDPLRVDLSRFGLSERQEQALRLAIGGLNNFEIAARLGLSRDTVKTHLGEAFRKLGARNRYEAIYLATASPPRRRGERPVRADGEEEPQLSVSVSLAGVELSGR